MAKGKQKPKGKGKQVRQVPKGARGARRSQQPGRAVVHTPHGWADAAAWLADLDARARVAASPRAAHIADRQLETPWLPIVGRR
jgi:hypothetical protein